MCESIVFFAGVVLINIVGDCFLVFTLKNVIAPHFSTEICQKSSSTLHF